jgi:hypothetical protein
MPEKDPWANYGFTAGDEDGAWIVPDAEIIPLPADRCPDKIADWTFMRQLKNPTPYDLPVFIVESITTYKGGRRKVNIYEAMRPASKASRDFIDIQEKWRPAPGEPPEPEETKILSRYERPPVI